MSMNNKIARRKLLCQALVFGAIAGSASGAWAQQTIKIVNIVELSGGGATAGTNFKNGVELAV